MEPRAALAVQRYTPLATLRTHNRSMVDSSVADGPLFCPFCRECFEGVDVCPDDPGQGTAAPVVIGSDQLEYDAGVGVARYLGQPALLRRGLDELRAAEIRLHDTAGEGQRLEAMGEVRSRVHPESRSVRIPSSWPFFLIAREVAFSTVSSLISSLKGRIS